MESKRFGCEGIGVGQKRLVCGFYVAGVQPLRAAYSLQIAKMNSRSSRVTAVFFPYPGSMCSMTCVLLVKRIGASISMLSIFLRWSVSGGTATPAVGVTGWDNIKKPAKSRLSVHRVQRSFYFTSTVICFGLTSSFFGRLMVSTPRSHSAFIRS